MPSRDGRILPLRAAAAEPVARVGGKAASLARARVAGLPALDGWVVPSDAARAARTAAAGFAEGGRIAQARLAVMATELEPSLRASLDRAGALLGGSLIVRSSTPLDDDSRWSGAFGSYLDVDQGDLVTAVLGCWASLFSRDVTERAAACGIALAELPLAVLVQPMVRFTGGGVARLLPGGSVRGSVVAGGPAQLLGGRAGGQDFVIADVPADLRPPRTGGREPGVDHDRLAAVADLSRQVYRRTGCDQIEWGWLDGTVALLQCRAVVPAASVPPATARDDVAALTEPSPAAAVTPGAAPAGASHVLSPAGERSARRLAALAVRFPGRLAEELILPWAVACAQLPGQWVTGPDAPTGDRTARYPTPPDKTAQYETASDAATETLRALCAELTAAAWARPPTEAMAEAAATLRQLRASLHPDALERLAALEPVDPQAAVRVLGLIAGMGARLQRRGCFHRGSEIWRHPLADVRQMLAGAPSPRPLCPPLAPQWDGFLAAACVTLGKHRAGIAAAPGVASGAPMFVAARGEIRAPEARRVLVVARPLPVFAPLLWGAAGLVSESGSPGAHLFDVARSLGVPAVAGCPLDQDAARMAAVVTVDGYGGASFVLAPDAGQGAGPGAELRAARERAS